MTPEPISLPPQMYLPLTNVHKSKKDHSSKIREGDGIPSPEPWPVQDPDSSPNAAMMNLLSVMTFLLFAVEEPS